MTDLQSGNHSYWYYAEYSTFRVLSEADNYKLKVAGYSGNTGYNALAYVNDRMLTTYDRDNDLTVKKLRSKQWWQILVLGMCLLFSQRCQLQMHLSGWRWHPSPLQSSRKCK